MPNDSMDRAASFFEEILPDELVDSYAFLERNRSTRRFNFHTSLQKMVWTSGRESNNLFFKLDSEQHWPLSEKALSFAWCSSAVFTLVLTARKT